MAREYYEKSIEIREFLAEKIGTVYAYDDLAVSYFSLAEVIKEEIDLFYKNKPKLKQLYTRAYDIWLSLRREKEYYKKAYEIWSTLAEQCPDNPEFARRRDIVKQYI